MPTLSFSAAVSEWVRKTEERMLVVFKESVEDVAREMQKTVAEGGTMPVSTGKLRASLRVTVDQPAPLMPRQNGHAAAGQPDIGYNLLLNGWQFGQPVYACFTANYARHVEYGTRGRPGAGFVRLAAQKWPTIVANNCARLKENSDG